MGLPQPSIQHLESAMEQMELELYHNVNDKRESYNDDQPSLTHCQSNSPTTTTTTTLWWTSPIPPYRSNNNNNNNKRRLRVSFRPDLITHVHERPKTTHEEREQLFYSSEDVKRFRREYKVFSALQRQRWMMAQQHRQHYEQYYSILPPTTQLLDSASTAVSQWFTSVTQLLSSTETTKSLPLTTNNTTCITATSTTATTATATTSFSLSTSRYHAEVAAATISEPNMFLIDTLYLF